MSGCACVRPGLQMEAVRMEVSLHSFFLLMLQFKKETHYEKNQEQHNFASKLVQMF